MLQALQCIVVEFCPEESANSSKTIRIKTGSHVRVATKSGRAVCEPLKPFEEWPMAEIRVPIASSTAMCGGSWHAHGRPLRVGACIVITVYINYRIMKRVQEGICEDFSVTKVQSRGVTRVRYVML